MARFFVCLTITAVLAMMLAQVNGDGLKFPDWNGLEVHQALTDGFADGGQVTFRKQFKVPRSGSATFTFELDSIAMIHLRATGVEPTRFSDIIVDENLQGTSMIFLESCSQ